MRAREAAPEPGARVEDAWGALEGLSKVAGRTLGGRWEDVGKTLEERVSWWSPPVETQADDWMVLVFTVAQAVIPVRLGRTLIEPTLPDAELARPYGGRVAPT